MIKTTPGLAFLCATLLALAGNLAADPLPNRIPASDDHLRYVGRFDASQPEVRRCAWSASSVELKFQGTDLDADLTEAGSDFWQVVIDGAPASVLELMPGEHVYPVATGLADGEHGVTLVKRTEPMVGTTQINSFGLNAEGKLLPVPERGRRIEVIGDSISCGYGNEAAGKDEAFSPKTENATQTYGAVAARALDADYVCIAWSGRKMWPTFTIPELYDLILPKEPQSFWKFATPPPDVVTINLATNDFGQGAPEREGWVKAYEEFVGRIRGHYPDAQIYCLLGPMMGDNRPWQPLSTARLYVRQVVDDLHAAGDAKVHFLEFPPQKIEDGIGANWHPSVKTHLIDAGLLQTAIASDLGWK